MKKNLRLLLFFFLLTSSAIAQDLKAKAEKAVTDYFFLERENIHVQCNKDIYINNENVWFKGYVFHRKKNVPFFTTINTYAALMDETGKVLETQLLYTNLGSFNGAFKLGNKYASGQYYIQFYTNWMNNFSEDESTVVPITIINQKTGAKTALYKADPSKLNITIAPEGGSLVSGVTSIVGLRVANCNNETANVSSTDLVDNAGNVIKKLQLNKLGYGRFDITPKSGETYKIIATTNNGGTVTAPLPPAKTEGITLEVNSLLSAEKTFITIRTNKANAGKVKPMILVVHHDDASNLYDVLHDKGTETKLAIANSDLFEGINTFRLLDENLNEIAQRIIFKYPASTLTTEFKKIGSGPTGSNFNASINHNAMLNISISALPENTIAIDENNDIYSSFWLFPYVENTQKTSGKYYFSTLTRGKAYELDLYLLNQKSKNKWEDILNHPPKDTYKFEMGLTVKGVVPTYAVNKNAKVRLFAVGGIDEITGMNEKGEFTFENMIIADSTHINLTVINKGTKPKEINVKPLIVNNKKPFSKQYKPEIRCIEESATPESTAFNEELPTAAQDAITLKETIIEKTRLKYEKSFGNSNLSGHKITEQDSNLYINLLQYITARGSFKVDPGSIGRDPHIYSRNGPVSINGGSSEPIIYIDGIQIREHSVLTTITVDEVDEIYMSPTAIVPSLRNYSGIIKIYLKPVWQRTKGNAKINTPDILLTGGFQRNEPFENTLYTSTISKGFENFGVIDWQAVIMTNVNGAFNFKIPSLGQTTAKVLIEGFSADGRIISEIKTLQLK